VKRLLIAIFVAGLLWLFLDSLLGDMKRESEERCREKVSAMTFLLPECKK